jgi:hypothetical protein
MTRDNRILRGLPASLLEALTLRAQAYGMSLDATLAYLLAVGLARDPRQAGSAGGLARSQGMTPAARHESAVHAATARWKTRGHEDTKG